MSWHKKKRSPRGLWNLIWSLPYASSWPSPACPTPCTSSWICLSTWPTGRAASEPRLEAMSRGERGPCRETLVRARLQGAKYEGARGRQGVGGYMPRLPQSRWAPGFGTELGTGAGHRRPMAAHCRTSPGAWERVARALDMPPPAPTLTHAVAHLLRAHIPQIVHSLRCSLLINKHILPVHHGEGIEHRAQGLDGCERNMGLGNSLLQIPPPQPRLP